MSERMSGAHAPGVSGVADYGRKSRVEMIAQFRAFYEARRTEADIALALSDDQIVTETYVGPLVMENREPLL